MADDVTPGDVRARRFDVVRRGYERAQVDAYLANLSDELDRLTHKLEQRKTKELQVGLDDPEALALELGEIGSEIATILESARAAADGMRTRAAADVKEWRSTTERDMTALTEETTEQSQSMRAAAWNEGSSMLSSAIAEAKAFIDDAKEDALFIRAEAEREAIRLTGDAKRDREELIRLGRLESEELIEGARRESDGMLAAANQQAEQAQERARALEERRSELLGELESTRDSISALEAEIDTKRQEMDTPEPLPETQTEERSHHGTDGGSVRIVAPSRSVKLKPVDAEDLVADVVALRTGTPVESESVAPTVADVIEPEPEPEAEAETVELETVAVIAPPPVAPEPVVDEQSEAADEGTSDEIGSLFASLRENAEDEGAASPPDDEPEPMPEEPAPKPESEDTAAEDETSSEPVVTEPDETPEPESLDATLIPLQNKALKEIKRTLVDLQNDALEQIRTDKDWIPPKAFMNQFKEPFSELARSITGSKKDGGAAKEFSSDLHAAVNGAMERARASGAGDREIASSVSRVFRMWRADESERRVVDAAQALSESS